MQPVETNISATISGISVVISFDDDNQYHSADPQKVQMKADSEVHSVVAKFSDIHLLMQVELCLGILYLSFVRLCAYLLPSTSSGMGVLLFKILCVVNPFLLVPFT